MAVEMRRGCGYRRVGGLYLMSGILGEACHRLPFELHVCPTCSAGIKPTRGWTWIDPVALLEECQFNKPGKRTESQARHCGNCVMCSPGITDEHAGLLWIGGSYYERPEDFMAEARRMGISRKIPALPRGFILGETWVYVAHRKACETEPAEVESDAHGDPESVPSKYGPGIISAFLPERVELILRESDATDERAKKEAERDVTVVTVPDGDPDHDPKEAADRQEGLFEEDEDE